MSLVSFLDYLSLEKNYSKHTVIAYEKDVLEFLAFVKITFDESNLVDIHYAQIRSWIVSLVDNDVSNRTVNRKISSLKAYYKFLLKIGEVEASPLAKHTSLKTPKRLQIPFSEVEVGAVFDRLKEADDFATLRDLLIVELLYATGMRRAELVDLTVGSIDVVQKTIKIIGKRNKERIVPMLSSVVVTYDRYIAVRSSVASSGEDALLVTNKGAKIYSTLVYRIINRYFSETSDKLKTSPHILRHSFATHLLNQGADLNIVKELLGHASLASTQVYTHNSVQALKDVYSKAHPRNKK
ncbi:integrase/recombinase XerC [Dokdonia sp. Hel_I_63]|uniref:tyrosine-type recombinase/integrase n=1 Tax=unclassified Dokdonia TaxID=2615033 RepID=UPI00020A6447|nr:MULTISPECIES: tyrosine-type recombinase/integrase [unclassified Dokdonia]AEE18359.1 integrase family protein [Dokdonia sp. 4H-3-7-5]TVZ22408.1 integrase/recombinase XerC [Dokdonia sp. Hel_I_63]